MSKVLSVRYSQAELTEGRATDAVPVWTDGAQIDPAPADREQDSPPELAVTQQHSLLPRTLRSTSEDPVTKEKNVRQRFGLPAGFVSRLGRYGRAVLFEDNIYRLPTGVEFIPQPPAGTLGSRNHQYALLTIDQFVKRKRGSVYIRTDGRIFDYAFDHNSAEREMFDTGFTIHDLERTGRYAPELKSRSSNMRNKGKKLRARKRK
jgi:hypothetical protein